LYEKIPTFLTGDDIIKLFRVNLLVLFVSWIVSEHSEKKYYSSKIVPLTK
jgi:hypothetical protein